MPVLSGSKNAYLDGIAELVNVGMANRDKQRRYPIFVDERSTKKIIERQQNIENGGFASRWPEGAVRPEIDFPEGYSVGFTQHQYASSVAITKVIDKFDQKGVVNKLTNTLMDTPMITQELVFAGYLDYGQDATLVPVIGGIPMVNVVGGDGLAIFSASHTWKNNPNVLWSNRSAAADDLTEDSFQTAYSVIRRNRDNAGVPLNYDFKSLIIPPDLVAKATRVLESRLQPDTANNAVNTIDQFVKSKKYLEHPWLTSTTAWYMLTDASECGLRVYWGWKPEFKKHAEEARTGNVYMTLDWSFAHGPSAGGVQNIYAVK